MPVFAFQSGLAVPACAVFGLFDSTRAGSGYLSHAGLADEEHTLGVHSSRWFHIWPTTSTTFYGGDHDFTRPDLIGFIDDLSEDETNRLITSKSNMDTLGQADPIGYIEENHPPVVEHVEAGRVCYRFTCVGVVLKCYGDAQLPLLANDHPTFPRVSLVGRQAGQLPYAAPGYLFHALARPPQDCRDPNGRYLPHVPHSAREACFHV